MAKVELEPERVTSQKEMDEFRRDLEQALAERDEAEKQADDDMEKLQNDLQLFKVMKYKEGYRDSAQGKSLRYPLGNEEEVLVQKTSKMPAKALAVPVNTPRAVVGATIEEGAEPNLEAGTSHKHHVGVV